MSFEFHSTLQRLAFAVLCLAMVLILGLATMGTAEAARTMPAPQSKKTSTSITLTWPKQKRAVTVRYYPANAPDKARTIVLKSKKKKVSKKFAQLKHSTQYVFIYKSVGTSWRTSKVSTKYKTPGAFASKSVTISRGQDSLTVNWRPVRHAKKYTIVWAPNYRDSLGNQAIPDRPDKCYASRGCKKVTTTTTAVTLTSAQLSSRHHRVSSRSGNHVQFRIFAHNGNKISKTSGSGAPYFVGSSSAATVDWLPVPSAAMPAPIPPQSGISATIGAFNVLGVHATPATGPSSWAQRRVHVASQIKESGATIFAIQEVSNASTNVPGGLSQMASLEEALGSDWAFADKRHWDDIDGDGIDRNLNNMTSQGNRVLYKTSEWLMLDTGAILTGDLDRSDYHVTSGDSRYLSQNLLRHIGWTKFQNKSDGSTEVCVISLHLLKRLTSGPLDAYAANRRAEAIEQLLIQLNTPGKQLYESCTNTPTVIAGDFNSWARQQPYGNDVMTRLTLPDAGFIDSKNARKRINTKYHGAAEFGQPHPTVGTQLDYVLVRGMGGAEEFRVWARPLGSTGSDHYPITATVRIPQTGDGALSNG